MDDDRERMQAIYQFQYYIRDERSACKCQIYSVLVVYAEVTGIKSGKERVSGPSATSGLRLSFENSRPSSRIPDSTRVQ